MSLLPCAAMSVISGGLAIVDEELGPKLAPKRKQLLEDAITALDQSLSDTSDALHTWYTDLENGTAAPPLPDAPWPTITVPDAKNFKNPGVPCSCVVPTQGRCMCAPRSKLLNVFRYCGM